MFVLSRNVSASYRVIATFVATAVVLWAVGAHHFAEAANITYVSDTLSDSDESAPSNHTISFKIPSGLSAGQSIAVTFPAGFSLTGIVEDDVDLEVNGTDEDTGAAAAGAVWGVSVTGQTLTVTSGTDVIGSTATVTIKVGTNATAFGTGANQIDNPSTDDGNQSFEIDISAGADSGHTRVVILENILVTASVDTRFEFTVYGNGNAEPVNGTTTTLTSSSTTIPFGTLVAGEIETLSQDLTVETNAIHGFVVTVHEDQHLLSSTGADIDNFDDSVTSATPVAWNSPSNNIANENTWGHWGMTSEDTATTRSAQFGSNQWVGVSTTPQVVFSHTGPADARTAGIGSTTVGYQVEITGLQEAADDYNTILTYIATPTF